MSAKDIRRIETIVKGLELSTLLEDLDYAQRISVLSAALCTQFVLMTDGQVTDEFIDNFIKTIKLNAAHVNETYKNSILEMSKGETRQ